jgi:Xaa-Pro aminopeptidase
LSLYEKRVERAQKLMQKAEIDYLFLGGGTDIKYLLNYQHGESERLGVFVLPSKGKGTYIGPKFEMLVLSSERSMYFTIFFPGKSMRIL